MLLALEEVERVARRVSDPGDENRSIVRCLAHEDTAASFDGPASDLDIPNSEVDV